MKGESATMSKRFQPKPDDRSDNVEKLQEMIENTMANIHEAGDFLKAHGEEMDPEEARQLEEKNRRRMEAIEGYRGEIKDELDAQKE